MKFLRTFDIDIIRLKEGEHVFPFDIGKAFFDHFGANDVVSDGDLDAKITLKRQAGVIEAWFDISGSVVLTCDRSLESFDQPLDIEERIVYKYGPEEKELTEEVFMITNDTPQINVAQLIYEFIFLAIPVKKLHPRYQEEEEEDDDSEGKMIYLDDNDNPDESESPENNPMWEQLKKLKDKE